MAPSPTPVLVVEDDPVTAMLVRRHLESNGYSVAQAPDGRAALELHRQTPFQIVVSDWNMPSMDGMSLCREFRRSGGAYVYFILCSSTTEVNARQDAFKAGVDDFLTKPINPNELATRLVVARRILASESDLRSQRTKLEETARRLAESNVELRALSRKYSGLFQGLPVACFAYDTDGSVREWNGEAEASFGIPATEASGRPVWDVLGNGRYSIWSEKRSRSLLTSGNNETFDWCYDRPDGGTRHFAANIICVRGDDSRPYAVVCASIDITERKQAEAQIAQYAMQVGSQKAALEAMNARLNQLAITDELTGLSNRRHFREELAKALANRKLTSISLLLLDLDHFKRINDARGHLAGDEVLRQFAGLLRENSQEGEVLARYGGEEFAILIPSATADEALSAGERYRRATEEARWGGLALTVSIGVASLRPSDATEDDLVSLADIGLYAAKASGRNRVCMGNAPLAVAVS